MLGCIQQQIKISKASNSDIDSICHIAVECFVQDSYYIAMFPKATTRAERIHKIFFESINICMKYGHVFILTDNNGEIVAFCSTVDYNLLKEKSPQDYIFLFPAPKKSKNTNGILNSNAKGIREITDGIINILYIIALAVKPVYQRKGHATKLMEAITNSFPNYNLITDISNPNSLPVYLTNGFRILKQNFEFTYVKKDTQDCSTLINENEIPVIMPSRVAKCLFPHHSTQTIVNEYFTSNESGLYPVICQLESNSYNDIEDNKIVSVNLSYSELLNYQRLINFNYFYECIVKHKDELYLCYVCNTDIITGIINPAENDINISTVDKDIVSDVIVCIPATRSTCSIDKIRTTNSNISRSQIAQKFISSLTFRTEYESGIPIYGERTYGSDFKSRLKHQEMKPLTIQLFEETQLSFDEKIKPNQIGAPIECSCILSYDIMTNICVVELIIPSSGLILTQFLDSMSRNQIMVQTWNETFPYMPIYQFLEDKFNIKKSGNPKAFVNLFNDKNHYSIPFLASTLFGETYYESDEGMGQIIDKDIIKSIKCENGIGQYNYATVLAYKNIIIQMSSQFRSTIDDRIKTESITLFYIELTQLEESALFEVNDNITSFLSNMYKYRSSTIMSRINTILSDYAKTSEFWDIQMNYPSSRKSVEEIRNAFKIDQLRKDIKTKKEMLLNICSIRDTILDETEGYFISILGIIIAALSCADLLDSAHIREVIGFVLALIFLFGVLRIRMNRHLKNKQFNIPQIRK